MNAYELADKLESFWLTKNDDLLIKAVTMLRQQADRIAELESGIVAIQYTCPNCQTHVELFNKAPQTKPLSDEEIAALKREYIDVELFDEGDYGMEYNIYGVKELVRAVEERHGIK